MRRWKDYWRSRQRAIAPEGVMYEGRDWWHAMACSLMWRPFRTLGYLWMRFKLRYPLPGDRFEDFQRNLYFRVVGVSSRGVHCEVRAGEYRAQWGDDWDALPRGAIKDYETVSWPDMRRMTTR